MNKMSVEKRKSWSVPVLLFGIGEKHSEAYSLCHRYLGAKGCEYIPGDKEEMEREGPILLTRGKKYTGLKQIKQRLEEIAGLLNPQT